MHTVQVESTTAVSSRLVRMAILQALSTELKGTEEVKLQGQWRVRQTSVSRIAHNACVNSPTLSLWRVR